jgi:hypothetical protein
LVPEGTTTTHQTTKLETMLGDGLENTSAQSALTATIGGYRYVITGDSPQIADYGGQ